LKIAEPELAVKARWVISTQLIIAALVATLFMFRGVSESIAAGYGGLSSLLVSLSLLWGINRATEAAKQNPAKGMRILYFGAAQRFLLVLLLLATGFAWLKLDPVAVCTGFAVAQLSYLFGSRVAHNRNE